MRLESIALTAAMACACSAPTASSPSRSPTQPAPGPTADDARSIATLLSPLNARAAASAGFTATYRMRTTEGEGSLRIAYLAPNQLRVDTHEAEEVTTLWFIDGVTTLRLEADKEITVAQCPAQDIDLWADCDGALNAAFPSAPNGSDPPPDFGTGPLLSIDLDVDSKESDHGKISMSAGWSGHRMAFFLWLSPRMEWDNARVADGETLYLEHGKMHAVISRKTGLIEKLSHSDSLDLWLTDFHDSANPEEFSPPDFSAVDDRFSAKLVAINNSTTWTSQRTWIYKRITQADQFKDRDSTELRSRAEPVFRALHRVIAKQFYEPSRRSWSQDIDRFGDWCESQLTRNGSTQVGKDEVKRSAIDWRELLEKRFAEKRDSFVELPSRTDLEQNAGAIAESLRAIERDAAREAFDEVIANPLLQRFDERVARALESHEPGD